MPKVKKVKAKILKATIKASSQRQNTADKSGQHLVVEQRENEIRNESKSKRHAVAVVNGAFACMARANRLRERRDLGRIARIKLWFKAHFFLISIAAFVIILGLGITMSTEFFNAVALQTLAYLPSCMKDFSTTTTENIVETFNDAPIQPHDWLEGPNKDSRLKVFSLEEIKYVSGGRMYLVMIGHVFDVTGIKAYYPGSGYHVFIGQDASRSFITGEFDNVSDDLEGLQPSDYLGLENWLKFYLDHKTYKFVGYLDGRFFNSKGQETASMAQFKTWLKAAMMEKQETEDTQRMFPSCNAQWAADTGSTVWCTEASGGISRDWIGYPRKFFEFPGKSARCACVHPNFLGDARVKLYDGCEMMATKCKLPKD